MNTASTFFALLALAAAALTAFLIFAALWRLVDPSEAEAPEALLDSVRSSALPVALLVAAVATGGSLYYSEGAGLIPCELCWYQRIGMYPLVPILAVAAFKQDGGVARFVLPLSIGGGIISGYHYTIQRFPSLSSGTCAADAPCTSILVWKFGFVSIPLMALCGFALITALMLLRLGDARLSGGSDVPAS